MTLLLGAIAVAFAWSMGAHYTGACMGMPYASGSIRLWPALLLMAPLAFFGAAVASHGVERTVGQHLIGAHGATTVLAIVIVAVAFLLTTIYTYLRIPTSTIQILVFSVAGAGLAAGMPVYWWTIARLAVIWVSAPLVACALGYVFTRLFDRLPVAHANAAQRGILPVLLVIVGAAASFTMGGNDVANATGVLIMTNAAGPLLAGIIGGIGLAIGVLTWGKPLLQKVAFDVVKTDFSMATAAQTVQAIVVFAAVCFGYFTSMNQALIGAMAGTGLARGRGTIQWPAIREIARGWAIAPPSGLLVAYGLTKLVLLVKLTG
jgi:PiT family inorganic phosphate transporter